MLWSADKKSKRMGTLSKLSKELGEGEGEGYSDSEEEKVLSFLLISCDVDIRKRS